LIHNESKSAKNGVPFIENFEAQAPKLEQGRINEILPEMVEIPL
jgi:hypothetical protein